MVMREQIRALKKDADRYKKKMLDYSEQATHHEKQVELLRTERDHLAKQVAHLQIEMKLLKEESE
jgi:uncharacterized coiled-coil DUF342 family protein